MEYQQLNPNPRRPYIESTVNIEDGYLARDLCVVDGFPAEIYIKIDTHKQRYSDYLIKIYDPLQKNWTTIYSLEFDEVGRLPFDGTDPETIRQLNIIAHRLWEAAQLVTIHARERQEEIDTADFVRNNTALDAARYVPVEDPSPIWPVTEVDRGELVHPEPEGWYDPAGTETEDQN